MPSEGGCCVCTPPLGAVSDPRPGRSSSGEQGGGDGGPESGGGGVSGGADVEDGLVEVADVDGADVLRPHLGGEAGTSGVGGGEPHREESECPPWGLASRGLWGMIGKKSGASSGITKQNPLTPYRHNGNLGTDKKISKRRFGKCGCRGANHAIRRDRNLCDN